METYAIDRTPTPPEDAFASRLSAELTAEDQHALDRLTDAVGSARMPAEWSPKWANSGTFSVVLDWVADTRITESIGYIIRREGGGWIGQERSYEEPVAEADTLPMLAEMLADAWGGPGRWQLAA